MSTTELYSQLGDILSELKAHNVDIERIREILNRLHSSIVNWTGPVPNLTDSFQREDVDSFLVNIVDHMYKNDDDFDKGGVIINFIARTGYRHEPKVDKDGKPLLRCTTAQHRVPKSRYDHKWHNVIRDLFKIYDRYDVNYTDDSGYTHFHVACLSGCEAVVKKFLELGQDPNILVQNTGDSPMHLAVESCNKNTIEILLRGGANPHLANLKGMTPLHVIGYAIESAVALFEISNELNQPLQVNARDNLGNTPLHLATKKGSRKVAELLLRRGADPYLTNKAELAPRHVMTIDFYDEYKLSKTLCNVSGEIRYGARVDMLDKMGNTPLHLALYNRREAMAEGLLRNGANPNLSNDEGSTALHIIFHGKDKSYHDDGLTKLFFKVTDEINQLVQVDAQDKLGRTPLQLAVANLMPNAVDLLLDHGASLSSFTFPDESCFVRERYTNSEMLHSFDTKLVSRAMLVVEHLEKRGYELDRSEALIIMKLLARRDPSELYRRWRSDEDFVSKAKTMMIKPNLSLYDLMLLRPQEATRKLTFQEFYEFVHTKEFNRISRPWKPNYYNLHLSEMMARQFFCDWALDPFVELTRYKLPVLCCDIIIKKLNNEDLYHICLAAAGQSS